MRFRRRNCAASENQIHRGARADQRRQSDHRNGRKAADFYFGLAEFGIFRGDYEIAETRQFHAAAETMAVNSGNRDAFRARELAKNVMKSGEHAADAIGRVIGNFGARGKRFDARAAKNQEIALGGPADRALARACAKATFIICVSSTLSGGRSRVIHAVRPSVRSSIVSRDCVSVRLMVVSRILVGRYRGWQRALADAGARSFRQDRSHLQRPTGIAENIFHADAGMHGTRDTLRHRAPKCKTPRVVMMA